MYWQLDDNRPIHIQLVEELISRILSGKYDLGEKMPSVRDLAMEAKVNPNTMQKALAELEERGFIFAKSTSGNYVTEDEELIKTTKQNLSEAVVSKFVSAMKSLEFDSEEIVNKVKKELSNDKMCKFR